MKKILVIRFSSIGDIVLTTPVLRCIKRQIPGSELHFVTKKSYSQIVADNPFIDKSFFFDNDLFALARKLKTEKYSLIIDLHNNLRSRILSFLLGVKVKRFNKLNIAKWLLVNFKIDTMPDVHIVDRYLNTAKTLKVKNDGAGLDFFIYDNLIVPDSVMLPQEPFIAWAIGGKHSTKIFPAEKIRNIVRSVKFPFVLLGDKYDVDRGRDIADGNSHVTNACGLIDLSGSASIVKNSSLVITNDTGIMHIAAAFKKKIISVWGSTVTGFGMYPYLPDNKKHYSRIVEIKDLRCRPCSKIGYKKCPKKHFKCMEDISEVRIITEINHLLEI